VGSLCAGSAALLLPPIVVDSQFYSFLFCVQTTFRRAFYLVVGRPSSSRKLLVGQCHVKSEFYATNIGWIPVEMSAATEDKLSNPARYFGVDAGNFLTLHVDPDLVIDSLWFGVRRRSVTDPNRAHNLQKIDCWKKTARQRSQMAQEQKCHPIDSRVDPGSPAN
jgi:hypothetical protein